MSLCDRTPEANWRSQVSHGLSQFALVLRDLHVQTPIGWSKVPGPDARTPPVQARRAGR